MLKIEGEPDLIKDHNGVIQNINENEFHAFITRRAKVQEDKNRIDKLEQDNAEIKNTLAVILSLLKGDNK